MHFRDAQITGSRHTRRRRTSSPACRIGVQAVFDPRGGAWLDRNYVPSLAAAIGAVIKRHMIDTGFHRNHRPLEYGRMVLGARTWVNSR